MALLKSVLVTLGILSGSLRDCLQDCMVKGTGIECGFWWEGCGQGMYHACCFHRHAAFPLPFSSPLCPVRLQSLQNATPAAQNRSFSWGRRPEDRSLPLTQGAKRSHPALHTKFCKTPSAAAQHQLVCVPHPCFVALAETRQR
eukprot:6203879-Pleurochrysis_carterae.AAC.1